MQKHVVIFLIPGIIFSSQVRAESVLVGLGDYNSQQNISDWRKGMIEDQSFEVELSEFTDPVWFVSYMPAEGDNDVMIRLIQQNEVLEEFENYLPDNAQGMNFTSLDAVSFVDYNLDGETDIFIVKTFPTRRHLQMEW